MSRSSRDWERGLLSGPWGSSAAIRDAARIAFGERSFDENFSIGGEQIHPLRMYTVCQREAGLKDGGLMAAWWDHAEQAARRGEDLALDDDCDLFRILRRRYRPYRAAPLDSEGMAAVNSGTKLLERVVPDLWADASMYICRMFTTTSPGLVRAAALDYPGLVVLDHAAFQSSESVAEILLREALYTKCMWLELGLDRQTNAGTGSIQSLAVPWLFEFDGTVSRFSPRRAFVELYVCHHLTLWSYALCESDASFDALEDLRRLTSRIAYLDEALRLDQYKAALGKQRCSVMRWLTTTSVLSNSIQSS